jgi:hypothetical protein
MIIFFEAVRIRVKEFTWHASRTIMDLKFCPVRLHSKSESNNLEKNSSWIDVK